jgi:DNA-binding Xre family transcriptional regulator
MANNKYDRMLNSFEHYYSYLYEQMIDWWPSGQHCLTVKLEDGTLIEFDSFSNAIRRIQPENYETDVETLRKSIGHNIKKIVQTRNMSQGDIAKRCGITEAMLSRYIHGTSLPSLDKVNALAAALGCRVIDIIGESYEN